MRNRIVLGCVFLFAAAAPADTVKPILVSANLLCAPTASMSKCFVIDQRHIGGGQEPPGYRFSLMQLQPNQLTPVEVDIGSEYFSAVNAQILSNDFDGTVLCGGSANVIAWMQRAIAGPTGSLADLVMCQIIYACPRHGGKNVVGREAHAAIDVHNSADAAKRLTLKC